MEMSIVTRTLLAPDALERLLISIEHDFRQMTFDGTRPTSIFGASAEFARTRVSVLTGLMTQVLDDHVANHPDEQEAAAQSRQKITYRMAVLGGWIASHLPPEERNRPAASIGTVCLRMALSMMEDYVDRLHLLTNMSIAAIDQAVAEVINADNADWKEFAAEAEALRHRSVFELMRLRARAVERANLEIPSLDRRMVFDVEARNGLIRCGLSHMDATEVVAALRRSDIPHVSIAH